MDKELETNMNPEGQVRRSDREPKPTQKMIEHRQEESERSEKKLNSLYEKWKPFVRDSRKRLKSQCDQDTLGEMLDNAKCMESDVLENFDDLRKLKGSVQPQLVRRVDACVAITKELMKIINERICEIEDFDVDLELERLQGLKKVVYPNSIFSSMTEAEGSVSSEHSQLSSKFADAAADLAAKQAELKALQRDEIQRVKLETELKRLDTEKEVQIAEARLTAYSHVMNNTMDGVTSNIGLSGTNRNTNKSSVLSPNAQPFQPMNSIPQNIQVNTNQDIQLFSKALADSVNLNRLPVPEPTVFTGDPLQYIEWRTSFEMLIERKGIAPQEKIYYLKRYTGGPARKALEGFFYSGSACAFDKAKRVLEERYGHPFIMQKAFRDKLDKWPKIGFKDPIALRDFADFLQGCKDAIPHISSLNVLNDCVENQRLLCKLPDHISVRWNREVTQALESSSTYPSFSRFVDFIAKEAKIACNPITSPYALNETSRKPLKDLSSKPNEKIKVFATATSSNIPNTKTRVCHYCEKDGHFIFRCEEFASLPIDRKRSLVREKRLCFGCLRTGHLNKDCQRKHTCGICKSRHPTCLHEDRPPVRNKSSDTQPENETQVKSTTSFHVSQVNHNGNGSSMIVPVWLSSKGDSRREVLTYALLDTQSDTTFVLEDTAVALEIPGQPVKLSLSTMTAKHTVIDSVRISDLRVRGFNSPHEDTVSISQAYTRDFIPADRSHIPNRDTLKEWTHLEPIINELPPIQSCEIGILIGYNCPQALAPTKVLIGRDNEPFAMQTLLGWSVVGTFESASNESLIKGLTCRTSVKELPPCCPRDVIKVLESDFANEKCSDKKISQEDIQFLTVMDRNIHQRNDKHLEMPLPFKERPTLPNNKSSALIRLSHLKRKFKRDQTYFDQYKGFMNEILKRGDAELVDSNDNNENVWYIPHHGVYHPKKPNKLRVVFDCSARYLGESLNEHLLTGPDLTNGLAGVLCRFRMFPIAIMCDIEKMFHQFVVRESDRDFLRFLWWEEGNLDKDPLEYRMKVHLFGAASSPGCANYGLKYLARIQELDFPRASQFVQQDFYVDDGLTSVETLEEATQIIDDSQTLCANGGLRLHKFVSNDKRVIESVPVSERAMNMKELDLTMENLPMERALGIEWCVEKDIFKFDVTIKNTLPTRRHMLSLVASVFDPLGLLSPFVLQGKRILQEMCQHGVGWDDPLPVTSQPRWEAWISDIHNLQHVQIPRCLKPLEFGTLPTVELHHFSDASSDGYGQCSYIRFVNGEKVHCSLLTSKARVAPLKLVTIPRLELTAAVLSVTMSTFLKEELNVKIDKEYFWTDSRVVLGYINNEARRFHVFVANRVQRIRDATSPCDWYYVSSEDNPADYASRGLSASEITSSSWLTGPSFLWQHDFQPQHTDSQLQLGDPEIRSTRSLYTTTQTHNDILDRLERFSDWTLAVSVTARLQRLSNGVKGTHPPTVEERQMAERTILKSVQQCAFSDTINALKTSKTTPQSDRLYPLDPILQDDILCVGGRLRKSEFPSAFKHPVILPKKGHVTNMILAYVHKEIKHQGRGMTLNKLRSFGYWICEGSKTVAKFIRNCVVCRKLRRQTEAQRMADLPTDRVEQSPPFTYCGMDCFGPFAVKQGRKDIKRYGLLFTCMCSRAIHIEMLDDMSTDAFINGLRCFMAIRGSVRQIRSDQGSNFIGAKNEFERQANVNKVTSYLAEKQCDFVMNAPDTSHAGGVWERQIKTVRNILNSIVLLCPGRLDDSSLRTLFYEVMSIVNSRPLAVNEISDPNALEPLTPNHILTAKSNIPQTPPGHFVKEDLYLRKRWRRVQYLLEQFWSRWKHEYIGQISVRQKWHEPRRNICEGNIVLVKDVDLPRNQWPLAKVVEVKVDDDGLVRRVKVKLGKSGTVIERSVQKLVLLIDN